MVRVEKRLSSGRHYVVVVRNYRDHGKKKKAIVKSFGHDQTPGALEKAHEFAALVNAATELIEGGVIKTKQQFFNLFKFLITVDMWSDFVEALPDAFKDLPEGGTPIFYSGPEQDTRVGSVESEMMWRSLVATNGLLIRGRRA